MRCESKLHSPQYATLCEFSKVAGDLGYTMHLNKLYRFPSKCSGSCEGQSKTVQKGAEIDGTQLATRMQKAP